MPESIPTKIATCPHCAFNMNAVAAVEYHAEHKPQPGHICICSNCGGVNRFTDSLQLEKVSDAELAEMPFDQHAEILRAQGIINQRRKLRAMRRKTWASKRNFH